MNTQHNTAFSNVELREVMAAANTARAAEMRRLFGMVRSYFAGLFAGRPALAAQR